MPTTQCNAPAEELPEALQLHGALSIACHALRQIVGTESATPAGLLSAQEIAVTALHVLRRDFPASRQHLAPGAVEYGAGERLPVPEEQG